MNRATPHLLIALTIFTAAASAQTLAHPTVSGPAPIRAAVGSPTNPLVLVPSTCPVGLRADPAVGLTQNTIDTKPGVPSQTLTLELSNPGSHNITRAQFTIHGLTAHGQVNPATLSDPDAGTSSKQVDLSLKVAHDSKASAPLLAEGFTSIRWIELDSLTYADGTAWHASPNHTCSVTPNRFMLVATH
jgi:hypothetical protein